ncbi:hypothetical protein [Clostridium beijerinckii]|uniref:Uncharacterized protein n=1 Tax=Clostridium beijerinckii TaxID=1520 RepID=A0AAW3W823_CLOBE|nr:hypothetical protein [Clostridium beijerinckii]MBC2455902.1 hypothetical protein [Clostridium beijerinckii]MBC2474707.1 hypothetical protein [Clostridium beijerinckii]NOV61857.1 hypothetical protein [Clostridium beijerinckii]NOV68647.1 hypothetical protein [Clostridium beijerinckii]NOW35240.1 hypothetical protein [Clostridium beijerinckii]
MDKLAINDEKIIRETYELYGIEGVYKKDIDKVIKVLRGSKILILSIDFEGFIRLCLVLLRKSYFY